MPKYIGAIDQGTTSTRFMIFDETGKHITSHYLEFNQIYPRPGWIEHDPYDILDSVVRCADEAIRKFGMMGHDIADIKAVGISNQRETTLLWDRKTGEPLYNAIVWGDTRTNTLVKELKEKQGDLDIQSITGLPIHNCFSAVKLRWLISNVPKVKHAMEQENALFGTVDSWLIWNLTGGIQQGKHVTDVTNASRTLLMNLKSREWDPRLLKFFKVPSHILPDIVSSSQIYGEIKWGPLQGISISGCLGDQQAALVGQKCFDRGDSKNTYGTGAFLLMNVGNDPIFSSSGLLSTVAFQFGRDGHVSYALEGSISVAGAAVKWLRDNLGMIKKPSEIDDLGSKVNDTGGVFFITAFSGLFAPYWRDDSKGTLVGLTQYTDKRHISRSVLEAVSLSTRTIIDSMKNDSDIPISFLNADGGMSNSDTCMQIQADILGMPVVRPEMRDTTALGAAIAAGLAVGVWRSTEEIRTISGGRQDNFNPRWSEKDRETKYSQWKEAIQRSFGWTDVYKPEEDGF